MGGADGKLPRSGRVTHLFLLLDIRHAPTAEDRQMFEWMLFYGVPFTLVATKADKLSRSRRQQAPTPPRKRWAPRQPRCLTPRSRRRGGMRCSRASARCLRMQNLRLPYNILHWPPIALDSTGGLSHNRIGSSQRKCHAGAVYLPATCFVTIGNREWSGGF
jgi:hypothetical protein